MVLPAYRTDRGVMSRSAALLGCELVVWWRDDRDPSWRWDGTPTVMITDNFTDTAWWQNLTDQCAAGCFFLGRLKWWCHNTAGQAAFYFGPDPKSFAAEFRAYAGGDTCGTIWIPGVRQRR
jgi:hypothetical protein